MYENCRAVLKRFDLSPAQVHGGKNPFLNQEWTGKSGGFECSNFHKMGFVCLLGLLYFKYNYK